MQILTRLGLIAIVGLGTLSVLFLAGRVVSETRLFTEPRFEGFWDDVEAYHLKPDARKSPAELSRQYGTKPVVEYILSPGFSAAYLPSERAVFVGIAAHSLSEDRKRNRLPLPIAWGSALILMYMPMLVAARQVQTFASWMVCRGRKARGAREAYFAANDTTRFWALSTAFVLTLALSAFNALTRMWPELRQRGVTAFELTGWLLVMAYFGGLWMQLVLYVVDTGFLAAGLNPHRSLWDEVIALAVMIPILRYVYQNSWPMIATTAVAALAAGMFVKWFVLRRETGGQRHLIPTESTEGFPISAENFGRAEWGGPEAWTRYP